MIYLSRMLGRPVIDAAGQDIGTVHDVAIATGEIFPRVTSLAFLGPDKTPFMLSWRKFVAELEDDRIVLNATRAELRFSYLQHDEVLLARDLLNKQIVDTQGMKVVRVNDLKLSESRNQLRLLGAEVGMRGILRALSPGLERAAEMLAKLVGRTIPETLIAWNYIDLLDRDLSHVKLSVTHKRLHELHPADAADILEKLSPSQRAKVFEHLDNTQAADALSEMEDELQADVIDDLSERRASDLLAEMDPDDAADIIGDLPYDKAETLLRLMGVKEAGAIRGLLGYKEKTAGGIMTSEVTTVTETMTVAAVIEHLRSVADEHESIYYVYVVGDDKRLAGVISLRDLLLSAPDATVDDLATRDLITANPDDDQELAAEMMSKYDLLALPVVDEVGKLLGIVTVDDALDVLEEEADEDLELATGRRADSGLSGVWQWVGRNGWLPGWIALFTITALVTRALSDGQPDEWTLAWLGTAALSLPVLRIAEDVASHAMAHVIEGLEPGPGIPWRRIGNDGVAGMVLGLVVGLVAFGVFELVFSATELGGRLSLGAVVGNAFGLSTLLVTLGGTIVGTVSARRAIAEKRVSLSVMTAVLMGLGFVSFAGLLLGGWVLVGQGLG